MVPLSLATESLAMIDHDLEGSLKGHSLHGGFLNGTTTWMINGKSQQEMDDLGGSPILGHFHMGVSDPVSSPLTVDKKSTS